MTPLWDGWLACWLFGEMVGWLFRQLVGYLVSLLVGYLYGVSPIFQQFRTFSKLGLVFLIFPFHLCPIPKDFWKHFIVN